MHHRLDWMEEICGVQTDEKVPICALKLFTVYRYRAANIARCHPSKVLSGTCVYGQTRMQAVRVNR